MKVWLKRASVLVLLAAVFCTLGGCVYGPGYYERPGVVYDDEVGTDGGYYAGPSYYGSGYYAPGYYGPYYGYPYYGGAYPWFGIGFSGVYYSHGGHYWHGGDHGHGGWHGGGHSGGHTGGHPHH
ncbi:MAG TPA: hypothetical protein VF132_11665 [Rudaea sp.]